MKCKVPEGTVPTISVEQKHIRKQKEAEDYLLDAVMFPILPTQRHKHEQMWAQVHANTYAHRIHTLRHTWIHLHKYSLTHQHTHSHVWTCVCMHIHTNACTLSRTCTRTHTHTHTHTYTVTLTTSASGLSILLMATMTGTETKATHC